MAFDMYWDACMHACYIYTARKTERALLARRNQRCVRHTVGYDMCIAVIMVDGGASLQTQASSPN